MKKQFKDKIIAIYGASLIRHGHFISYMRSYMMDQEEKCYVFNRGVGGNTAFIGLKCLEDEILTLKPDVVIFTYSGNDMGIWLYDANKEETEELIAKRRARNETYFKSLEDIIIKLKENGITPIIGTPFPYNENIERREDVKTLADNKEKEDYIGPSFYTPETFTKLNKALSEFGVKIKELAKKHDIDVIDIFAGINKNMPKNSVNYIRDGIHYTPEGHKYAAKVFLEYLGYENVGLEFKQNDKVDEIREVEELLRMIQFVRRPYFLPDNKLSEREIVDKFIKEADGSPYPFIVAKAEAVKNHFDDFEQLRAKEKELILSMFDEK